MVKLCIDKKALRREIASQVGELPREYCQTADEAICRNLLMLPAFREAGVVFCYAGTDREIDTRPILRVVLTEGKILAMPLCTGPGVMEARRVHNLEELVPGKYGILTPGTTCPLVKPEDIGLAVVPCSTGNAKGQRLGYGGGFYDRFLLRTRCPRVLLCRARLVRENIPVEEHDLTVDIFVTEDGAVHCR